MPRIWCSISSHGFGHAAQVIPVLNNLARILPDTQVILRTHVPESFFRDRLTMDWTVSPSRQDIGCIQEGPLSIQIEKTWAEHRQFHLAWPHTVEQEAHTIKAARPDLILSNISYLAIEAGARLHIPTIALGSLSWDRVLEYFQDHDTDEHRHVVKQIRHSYGQADSLLHVTPSIDMKAFSRIHPIGPLSLEVTATPQKLRHIIGASPDETVVLVGFGGIPFETLPFTTMNQLMGYHIIVDGVVPPEYSMVHSIQSLPIPFSTIVASADIILTKPGYSTILEAVSHGTAVVFVRRYNFVDEEPLVRYLTRYGRGIELSQEDFLAGRWQHALQTAATLPAPSESPPPSTGGAEAAEFLSHFF